MKEQILKILTKNFVPLGEMDDDEACAREITSHVMKFIEWLNFGDNDFYPNAVKNEIGYYREGNHRVWALEEVYQYWLTEVTK